VLLGDNPLYPRTPSVFRARTRYPPYLNVAVKVCSRPEAEEEPPEVRISKLLQITNSDGSAPENLIRLFDWGATGRNGAGESGFWLIEELADYGNLFDTIYNKNLRFYSGRSNSLSTEKESEARRIMTGVLKGLRCMHEKLIAHLNISLESIMICDSNPRIFSEGVVARSRSLIASDLVQKMQASVVCCPSSNSSNAGGRSAKPRGHHYLANLATKNFTHDELPIIANSTDATGRRKNASPNKRRRAGAMERAGDSKAEPRECEDNNEEKTRNSGDDGKASNVACKSKRETRNTSNAPGKKGAQKSPFLKSTGEDTREVLSRSKAQGITSTEIVRAMEDLKLSGAEKARLMEFMEDGDAQPPIMQEAKLGRFHQARVFTPSTRILDADINEEPLIQMMYASPEVLGLSPEQKFDLPLSDIYSAGIVLFILLMGHPHCDRPNRSHPILRAIWRGELGVRSVISRFRNGNLSGSAISLLGGMLSTESQRMTLDEVLSHEFFCAPDKPPEGKSKNEWLSQSSRRRIGTLNQNSSILELLVACRGALGGLSSLKFCSSIISCVDQWIEEYAEKKACTTTKSSVGNTNAEAKKSNFRTFPAPATSSTLDRTLSDSTILNLDIEGKLNSMLGVPAAALCNAEWMTGVRILRTWTELRHVEMAGNGFRSFPRPIFFARCLQTLDLSCNRIPSLPRAIHRLERLSELRLGHNLLESLPEEIGTLSQLSKLILENNRLSSLPSGIFRLSSLQFLNLRCNKIRTLAPGIGALRELRNLQLSGNGLCYLPEDLGTLKKLENLLVARNELKSLPLCLARLGENHRLRILGLSFNPNLPSHFSQGGLPSASGRAALQTLRRIASASREVSKHLERLPKALRSGILLRAWERGGGCGNIDALS